MPTMPKSVKPAHIGVKQHQSMQLNQREAQAFYQLPRWRRESWLFKKENPLCVNCLNKNIIAPSEVTDHNNPISNGADPWDKTNWQPLCKTCHNIKRSEESKQLRRAQKDVGKGEGGSNL